MRKKSQSKSRVTREQIRVRLEMYFGMERPANYSVDIITEGREVAAFLDTRPGNEASVLSYIAQKCVAKGMVPSIPLGTYRMIISDAIDRIVEQLAEEPVVS